MLWIPASWEAATIFSEFCSENRQILSAIEPSKSSMSWGRYPMCGPSSSLFHCAISAPSNLTHPARKGHTPNIALARLVLPAALGPIIPRTSPAFTWKLTPLTAAICAPGGITTIWSTDKLPRGAGRLNRSGSNGKVARPSLSLKYWSLATTNSLHEATMASIGASARPNNKEPAIISPGEISPLRARKAPNPNKVDWEIILKDLDIARSSPALSLAIACFELTSSYKPSILDLMLDAMPIASITSAFLKLLWKDILALAASVLASPNIFPVIFSVVTARAIITITATIAEIPNRGWNRNMTPM